MPATSSSRVSGWRGRSASSAARVLVIGAGGLGSPALLYLAAAGVGTIGVVDADVVELTNLHRQVIHSDAGIGRLKTESAEAAVHRVNPHVRVVRHDRAARLLERARDPRRLRRRRRRHRQLPDPLPRQRRLRPARQAPRVGLDPPLRRPGVGVVGGARALLPVRLPRATPSRQRSQLRGGRGPRGALRRDRVDPVHRGGQAPARAGRPPRRTVARPRRAAPDLGHAHRPCRPRLPGLR